MADDFDKLIQLALVEKEQNVTLPPVDDVWNNIKERIRADNNKHENDD